jgi:hypothetical protein
MPTKIEWDNDAKTIIRLEFSGSFTWKEYDEAVDQVYALIKAAPHHVDIISFMQPTVRIPKGDAIIHIKRAFTTRPKNMRKGMLIGSDLFGATLVQALVKVKGIFDVFIAVESVDAARAFLTKLDQGAAKPIAPAAVPAAPPPVVAPPNAPTAPAVPNKPPSSAVPAAPPPVVAPPSAPTAPAVPNKPPSSAVPAAPPPVVTPPDAPAVPNKPPSSAAPTAPLPTPKPPPKSDT